MTLVVLAGSQVFLPFLQFLSLFFFQKENYLEKVVGERERERAGDRQGQGEIERQRMGECVSVHAVVHVLGPGFEVKLSGTYDPSFPGLSSSCPSLLQ